MARTPRYLILGEGSLFHVTWQCHNRDFLLKPLWAKKLLFGLLLKYKAVYGMTFFSYIIMDNHFHISGQAPSLEKFSAFFQVVHSVFAKRLNKRRKRYGQVVRDRFKSPLLEDENVLIKEMIYHVLNEVRCGKSNDPTQNTMSSYAFYAEGRKDPLITPPPVYLQLGTSPQERQMAYRAMVLDILVSAPRKKNGQYTTQLFVGDPHWVKNKYEEFKTLRKELNEGKFAKGWDPPPKKKAS